MDRNELMAYPKPVWVKKQSTWIKKIEQHPWNAEAIIRGGYRCKDCSNGHIRLHVHHIDETGKTESENNDQSNLVVLCSRCHSKRHGRENFNLKDTIRDELTKNGNVVYMGMYNDIAKKLHVSRERVRQIAKSIGILSLRRTLREQREKTCVICGKKSGSRKYCSLECFKKYRESYFTTIQCKFCGKTKKYLKSSEYRKPVYCSRECHGKDLGSSNMRSSNQHKLNITQYDGLFSVNDAVKKEKISMGYARVIFAELVLSGKITFVKRDGRIKLFQST